uniref:Uncharacterized protein n=1 Tax=Cyprinus carpio TaxID=7962 RepID=A0A8C1IJW8_CYPCA
MFAIRHKTKKKKNLATKAAHKSAPATGGVNKPHQSHHHAQRHPAESALKSLTSATQKLF